jgi:hypothetical protein
MNSDAATPTVRKWDAERTSRTIELYIGKDLQESAVKIPSRSHRLPDLHHDARFIG